MRRRVAHLRINRTRSRDLYSCFRRFENTRRIPLISPVILYAQFFFSPVSDYFYRVSQVTSDAVYYGTTSVAKNLSSRIAAVSYFFCRFTEPYFNRFHGITMFDRHVMGVLSYCVRVSPTMMCRLVVNFAQTRAFGAPAARVVRSSGRLFWRFFAEKGLRRFSKLRYRYVRRFNIFSSTPRRAFLCGYAVGSRKHDFTILHRASYALWVWNLFLEEGAPYNGSSSATRSRSDFMVDIERNIVLAFKYTKKRLYAWFKLRFGDANSLSDNDSDSEDNEDYPVYDEGFTFIGLLRKRLLLGNVSRCVGAISPWLASEQRVDPHSFNSLALFDIWHSFLHMEDQPTAIGSSCSYRRDWLCFLPRAINVDWISNFQHNSILDDLFSTSCPVPTKLEAMAQVSLYVYWDIRMQNCESRLYALSFAYGDDLDRGALYSVGMLSSGLRTTTNSTRLLQHSELSSYKSTLWDYASLDDLTPTYVQHMSSHRALSEQRLHLYNVATSAFVRRCVSTTPHAYALL